VSADGFGRIGTLPDKLSLSQMTMEILQYWHLFLDYWTNRRMIAKNKHPVIGIKNPAK
jgi:hypothetical protein